MNVSAILAEKGTSVFTLKSGIGIMDAVRSLRENKVGALIVSDDGQSIDGILSERDIVRGIAELGAACLERNVADLMTRDVVTCSEDATVSDLMELMTQGRFRHLPVVRGNALVGIVSIGDIVKRRIADVEREAEEIRSYIATA
ncbi:MAG: CBS domain-containing protein [Pseudomonadota bacterium]